MESTTIFFVTNPTITVKSVSHLYQVEDRGRVRLSTTYLRAALEKAVALAHRKGKRSFVVGNTTGKYNPDDIQGCVDYFDYTLDGDVMALHPEITFAMAIVKLIDEMEN